MIRCPALSCLDGNLSRRADDDARRFPRGEQAELVGFEHPQLIMYRLLGRAQGQKEFDVGDGLSRNYRNAGF
jgi:hypothetical protein